MCLSLLRGRLPNTPAGPLLVCFTVTAAVAPLVAPYPPDEIHLDAVRAGFSAAYWLGTDHLGRDELSRLVVATRVSLLTVALVFAVSLPLGIALGAVAGWFGGILDTSVLRVTDVVVAVPGLLIGLVLASVLGPGIPNLVIALAAATWAPYARLLRTELRVLRHQPLTEALVLLGVPAPRILLRHLVPAVIGPLIVLTSTEIAGTILGISALTSLGLGVRPPTPEWGSMIVEARPYLADDPALFVMPLLGIGLVVLAVNVLTEGAGRWATHGVGRSVGIRSKQPAVALESSPRTAAAAASTGPGPLLSVNGLRIDLDGPHGRRTVVDGLSFDVASGEVLAIVGPSGSGKSLTLAALLGLLPDGVAAHAGGSVRFEGAELIGMPPAQLRSVRGGRIGLIPQDPNASLDPLWSVGSQIAEGARLHRGLSRAQASQRALELLSYVGIEDPRRVVALRPAQLSGGMGQRVLIAAALAAEPALILADEPTSALDAPVALQVLRLLARVSAETGVSVVVVTHDVSVVNGLADRVAVFDNSRIVEAGATAALMANPVHPLTRAMVGAISARVATVAAGPHSSRVSSGALTPTTCQRKRGLSATQERSGSGWVGATPQGPILRVQDLDAEYRSTGLRPRTFRALSEISLELEAGQSLGVVGASGSGKTTLARMIVGLEVPHSGSVRVYGEPPRAARATAQLVFQDTLAALDRRQTVGDALTEAIAAAGSRALDARPGVAALLQHVGLSADLAARGPWQLSGGQPQRVCIARALAAGPRLLVLDEPVSSLDVLVQAEIIHLLDGLRGAGLTLVVISHDLAVVERLADHLIVLDRGRVVEHGRTSDILRDPVHPITQALIEARPSTVQAVQRERVHRPDKAIQGVSPSVVVATHPSGGKS